MANELRGSKRRCDIRELPGTSKRSEVHLSGNKKHHSTSMGIRSARQGKGGKVERRAEGRTENGIVAVSTSWGLIPLSGS